MNINSKILSIPPYISTSWKNIASLHIENQAHTPTLIVTLLSGTQIPIPNLEPAVLEVVFAAHARFVEQEEKSSPSKSRSAPLSFPLGQEQIISLGIPLPLKNGIGGIEQMGSLLQHNPEQASGPDLPSEILHKIAELAKTMGIEDANAFPKPEPHCNCMRCQIAKAMQAGLNGETPTESEEEIVSDEDLKFKTWDVAQTGDKLYIVTNPLDDKEHYNVYLGEPVGCTCGEKHCEHIRAVLSS